MANCPQCQKPLREMARKCPSCQADLDLLVDFTSHLGGKIDRAAEWTRAGELGPAIWAYLEVLEVDPNNAVARKQISQIVTAVRQFDRVQEGPRWQYAAFASPGRGAGPLWAWMLGGLAVALLAFGAGFLAGWTQTLPVDPNPPPPPEKKNQALS